MSQLTRFHFGKRYADDSGYSHSVDVDVQADTLYIEVNGGRLLAAPSDIDWLIEALSDAKQLMEMATK